ncbi:MAG: hypothetical protein ACLPTF_04805 [Steroidobacteraceae bacterium]
MSATIPLPPNEPPVSATTDEADSDAVTLKALDAELDATIAVKLEADRNGTPDQRTAANAAHSAAHAKRWDFARAMGLRANGALDANRAELKVLDTTVQTALLKARSDVLFLHNNFLPAPVAAARMFSHLGQTGEMYRRGGAVVELDANNRMTVISPAAFRSRLNRQGRRVMAFARKDGVIFPADKLCNDDEARVLLNTSEVDRLPEIKLVVSMPVLVESGGVLRTTQPGYNADCGVLVTSNVAVGDVEINEAVAALLNLLRDFKFASHGDKSRAISGIIGPAIRMGALLGNTNALVHLAEADDSQAGKGLELELTHTIYGEKPRAVVQREGGVGSFDESLSYAMLSGAPFIVLDNLRGSLRSTHLEGALTPVSSDKRVAVRIPHRGEVMVDISRVLFQATSNGVSSTIDLANRLLINRIIKKPGDYPYYPWPEIRLIDHVEKYSAYYLSCVHSVVRYWHASGKPRLPTEHTFKDWVGSLDWIVRNIFRAAPLLDGHGAAAQRLANPSLTWLRQLAHAVLREGKEGRELRAGDLREVCERCDLMPEGVKPGSEENVGERAIGRTLGTCFDHGDAAPPIEVDGIRVARIVRDEKDSNRIVRPAKFYTFNRVNS